MKKMRALVLAVGLCLVVVLSACAPASQPDEAAPADETKAPEEEEEEAEPAAQEQETITWKFQSNVSSGCLFEAGQWWASEVEAASDGRLKIEMYPAGQLVKTADFLDALRENVIQVATTCPPYYKGFMPEAGVLCSFPAAFKEASDQNYIFYELGYLDLAREAYAEHGAYLYCCPPGGNWSLWATKPLVEKDDFKDLKVRAVSPMTEMFSSLGASAVYLPHEESYTALQLGTIGGYTTVPSLYIDLKHYEVCPYIMTPAVQPISVDGYSLSMKALEDLPDDLQTLVKSMAPSLVWKETNLAEVNDRRVLGMGSELGFEVVPMSDDVVAAMEAATLETMEAYASENTRCAQMVEILKGYMTEMGIT